MVIVHDQLCGWILCSPRSCGRDYYCCSGMLRTGVTKCLRRVLDKISVWFEGVRVAARIIERLFGMCITSRDASDEDVQIFVFYFI
jgi:hypothetical protein